MNFGKLAAIFVAAGVFLRLVPHPMNVAPLTATALFAGAALSLPSGAVSLFASLFLTDLILGLHSTMPFTWGAALIVLFLGRKLGSEAFRPKIFAYTLLGSVVYFVVTNLGVFFAQNLYPKTWAGLWECFIMALPFFRNSVLGDLAYTAALFLSYAFLRVKFARANLRTPL